MTTYTLSNMQPIPEAKMERKDSRSYFGRAVGMSSGVSKETVSRGSQFWGRYGLTMESIKPV
jgi:hypothetical protein